MKLISKTLLYYLLISLPLIVVAGIFSYYLIQSELRDGTDESLQKEKIYAEDLIKTFSEPHKLFLSADSLSLIVPVNDKLLLDTYSDVKVYDNTEQEFINYRILKSYFRYHHNTYMITVSKTTLEEDELMEGLFSAFALIIAFLMIGFIIVNWSLSKMLWKPFYKTLDALKTYDIALQEKRQFEIADTLEFNKLNEALTKMTEKIYKDFSQQKEFTENASHEMQTPLAVIKAHLDLLIQSPNLKEDDMNHIQTMENTIKKLTSLNKALILLSKIDNNQFKENGLVNLNQVIEKVAENYADLIQSKKIKFKINKSEELKANINNTLADILVSNLFQNATRHNVTSGEIIVNINHDSLMISNTGEPLTISPDELFVRFKKDDSSKESLGLGLSIIKSILDSYGYSISYNYINQLHVFEVTFK